MKKLSICIPTYNRAKYLTNCLHSIMSMPVEYRNQVEVCVSDNWSSDGTAEVVRKAQQHISVSYQRNESNIGIPRNFIKVVGMASGEFVWLIGDDDLLLPDTFEKILKLLNNYQGVDFFYINSFHLSTEYVFSFPQPFNTVNLPVKMIPFSSYRVSGEMRFMDLINPRISFDFLGGMFLAVFRRENWLKHQSILNQEAIKDTRLFSHFDNTFPHVKIFANAFAKSKAYFHPEPLSVCLTGAREWSPMYPLIHSIRLIEALEEYKKNGLPYYSYWKCRNFALNNFVSDLGSMVIYRNTGIQFINPFKVLIKNSIYPNTYFSFFTFILCKSKAIALKIFD